MIGGIDSARGILHYAYVFRLSDRDQAAGRPRLAAVRSAAVEDGASSDIARGAGGVTGWLRAASLFGPEGIPVCSHGMQELHVSLVAGYPSDGWVEAHSFDIDQYTARPLPLGGGQAVAPDEPGTGVSFLWEMLASYAI